MKAEETTTAAEGKEKLPVRRPAVDVWEDAKAVHVVAEIPGVSKENLTLHVEKGRLHLVGRATATVVEGFEQSGAEYVAGSFQRQFRLSDDIDTEKIEAQLRNGVLRLTLPKQATTQPRRIVVGG